MSKEYNEFKCLLRDVQNETLRNRIDLSLKYYINKAVFYKLLWNWLSIFGIILPVTATFLSCLDVSTKCKWLIPLITSLTTIIVGILTLFKCTDKKNSYRESAEKLKSELNAYVNKYNYAKNSKNKESILCEHIENIIADGYTKIIALDNNPGKPLDDNSENKLNAQT